MGATTVTTESTAGQAGRTRLHITPFNADLVDRFLPPNVRAEASNISFHAVQTFPERGFGYVELPTMEAQKLKKKFNGTILKGTKVKIEEAKAEKGHRSKKRKKPEAVAATGEEAQQKQARVEKKEKPKKGEGILLGFSLPEGRHVKRGWEELPSRTRKGQSADKSGEKGLSKKTGLFKTTVPPNATPLKSSTVKAGATPKPAKGSREGKKSTVVKEFKKTSRLLNTGRGARESRTTHFEDGVGWVDENGDVVEAAPKSRRPQTEPSKARISSDADHDVNTRIGMASSTEDALQKSASEADLDESADESAHEAAEDFSATSSPAESSSDDDDSESSDDSDTTSSEDISESKAESQSDAEMDDAQSRETTPVPTKKEIHPLEALFKRAPPSSGPETSAADKLPPIDTSFSFFSGVDDDDADGDDLGVTVREPQTPHSKEDLEWRTIRSAAPTPDTAAVGKRFIFPLDDEPNDVDDTIHGEPPDDMEDVANVAQPAVAGEKVESEFRKWFYENRGDLNRAWKKRRREEKKLKRQRESRRLGRKLA